MKRWFAILFISLSFLACGKPDQGSSELSVSISKVGALLPIDIQNCEEFLTASTSKSTKANSVRFGNFKLTWAGSQDVEIISVEAKFSSSALATSPLTIPFIVENLVIAGGDTSEQNIICGLRLGGISLKNSKQSAYITGRVVVKGVATDSEGNASFVTAEAPIEMQYAGYE